MQLNRLKHLISARVSEFVHLIKNYQHLFITELLGELHKHIVMSANNALSHANSVKTIGNLLKSDMNDQDKSDFLQS